MRRILRPLLRIKDTPKHIALSFAVGVFMGFSPLLGLHAILGLAAAFLFRLNKVAVLIGVYSNQPWIMVPYYGFATWLGIRISGFQQAIEFPQIGFREVFTKEFWQWIFEQHRLLMPAFVGSFLLCTILALLAYAVTIQVVQKLKDVSPEVQIEVDQETNRS